jgi:hypothetical protein
MLPAANKTTAPQRLDAARFVQSVVMWCWLVILTMQSIDQEPSDRTALIIFAALFAAIGLQLFFYQRKMIKVIKAEQ